MRGATVVSKPELSYNNSFLMDDSTTIYIGDLVTLNTDGHVALITSSDEKIAGVVIGFVGADGEQPTLTGRDYITTASDNTTVATYRAVVDIGRNIILRIDADATLATTNVGQFFDLNNSYQVDVADASDSSGALQLIELDPLGESDLSMGVYYIADHQFQQLDS